MSSIVLLDTCVYLNVLDVPGFNQERNQILDEFGERVSAGDYFLLPMAAIWETDNHIAHLSTGGRRNEFGLKLVQDVTRAVNGDMPYRPRIFPTARSSSPGLPISRISSSATSQQRRPGKESAWPTCR